ncbi:hypothetical protein SAMN05421743_102324 [Thalassobacillus cyri]|uniref:Phr family secreted Rap phosphatase inhibitor n=1 Tax=Thalassobacillus cyri TaxID=571932 RepID=A0A1H3Y2L7_9BACI|nr:hypothetical protein [Thalassobacillus cyri]SEA05072.1 hypothetical protein SAMN05421743_102324 [Thalassobacillus cyri]
MKKLLLLVLLFSLIGTINVVDNLDDDSRIQIDNRVIANNDPGDGGMGSWK